MFSFLSTMTDYSFVWTLAALLLSIGTSWIVQEKKFNQSIKKQIALFSISVMPFLIWSPIFLNKLQGAQALESYLNQGMTKNFVLDVGSGFRHFSLISDKDNVNFILYILGSIMLLKIINRKKSSSFLLFYLGTVPIIISVLYSYVYSPILLTKNIFISFFPFLTVIAAMLERLERHDRLLATCSLIAVSAIQLGLVRQVVPANTGASYLNDSLRVAQFIENISITTPIFLDDSIRGGGNLFYYYLKNYQSGKPNNREVIKPDAYELPEKILFVVKSKEKTIPNNPSLIDNFSCTNVEDIFEKVEVANCFPMNKL
jgi:hypothetical protein